MVERRGDFNFGIVYETDPDLAAQIPGWVKDIVEEQKMARFDRCHFKSLGQWARNSGPCTTRRFRIQGCSWASKEKVNLALMQRLADAGVEFAYPTQLQYERRLDSSPPRRDADREITAIG